MFFHFFSIIREKQRTGNSGALFIGLISAQSLNGV